jgi:hypothetical protein
MWELDHDDDRWIEYWRYLPTGRIYAVDRRLAGLPPLNSYRADQIGHAPLAGPPRIDPPTQDMVQ